MRKLCLNNLTPTLIIMLGLDGYGSGSESESESQEVTKPQSAPATASNSKSKFNLPPPSSNGVSSKISLPPPKTTKRAPKKITIGLPTLSKDESEQKGNIDPERPPAKRQKISGAGSSGLLSMLPAPKQKAPVAPHPERVLGGGKGPGLVFNTRPSAPSTQTNVTVEDATEENDDEGEESIQPTATKPATSSSASSLPFLPPSLVKGKANVSLEDKPKVPVKPPLPSVSAAPTVDFFSLGTSLAKHKA